jgi:hypothetical protein
LLLKRHRNREPDLVKIPSMTRIQGQIMKLRVLTAAALVTFAALGSAGAADLPPPVYKSAALPPPAPI